MQDRIEYEALVQQALRNVIRDILADAAKNGLPGDHHFYITFATQYAGVEISDRLKERFPEAMTIVLQHRFWDMRLYDDSFTVTLSFGGIAEKLLVPFAAMQVFYDPAAAFEVAFNTGAGHHAPESAAIGAADSRPAGIVAFPPQPGGQQNSADILSKAAPQNPGAAEKAENKEMPQENAAGSASIVRLDAFRKK